MTDAPTKPKQKPRNTIEIDNLDAEGVDILRYSLE